MTVAALLTLALSGTAAAGSFTIVGPRTFTRSTGLPVVEAMDFTAPATQYVLHIEADGVASAIITLNGATVVTTSAFDNNVRQIDRSVRLRRANHLTVEVRGDPGGTLRIWIEGQDDVPPQILASASPSANRAGWNNTNVVVTFTCSDPISGIAKCPAPVLVSAEGARQVITGEAEDVAGNRAQASVTLNVDKTAPGIAPVFTPVPNASGWNNTDVTVAFACADGLSGIASCTPARQFSVDGANQPVSGQAVDLAGNTAASSAVVNLDKALPRIAATLSTPPNADGWHSAPVTVTFACEDDGSGVASCPSPVTVGGEGASQTVRGVVRDHAGNSAEASVTINLDLTAPRITATLSEPANPAGWHRRDVTVTFTCADDVSGAADCPAPRVVSTEGADQQVSATVTDRAGRSATASVTISLDKTAPTIAASREPAANEWGWHRTPVVVSFACADGGSGIASCTQPVTVAQEGAAVPVAGVARDQAGNEATADATLKIDLTPPAIRAIPSAVGLTNADVTVEFVCEDSGSGIESCPPPAVISSEGLDQVVERTATDRAGNSSSATVSVSIDKTSPTITAIAVPTANAAGWTNAPAVTVSFTCDDTGSGVATCPDPVQVTTEGGGQNVTGTATDRAGNSATVTLSLNLDRTPPTITATAARAPNAQGWYNAPVRVEFQCADSVSAIASCTAPIDVSIEGASQSITGTAVDSAGNAATASAGISLDRTPPSITITSPAANAVLPVGNAVVTGTIADTLSGIASVACGTAPAIVAGGTFTCTVPLTNGANVIAIAASDRAGNPAQAQLPVIYTANANPVARPGGPYSGETGRQLTLSGAESSDPEGQALTFAWTFGDGATATGASVTHTYQNPGVFSVELTVRDTEGGTSTASTSATIVHANRAPVADAGGPYAGDAAQVITLTASNSSDPDGDTLTYSWSLGDGTSATGAVVRRAYSTPGNYTATVTVTDSRGASASAAAQVTVRAINQRPVASVGGPYSGEVGRSINFSGSGSSDPDQDPLTYAWTFGDGATATGVSSAHSFSTAGSYTVTLTVSDGRGGSHSASTLVPITVPNQAPVARVTGPTRAQVGDPLAFDATTSTDAENDFLTFAWTFGDGRSATGPASTHAFDQAGTFTVSVNVSDGRGASSASLSVTIDAAPQQNRPPVAHAGGPYNAESNLPITFDGSRSSDPDREALTYAWDFGDGQTGSGNAPAHAYAEARQYTVTLTVTDARGASASASSPVTVIPQADRSPPLVSISAPREVLPGTRVTIRAQASDNVGVTSLTFEVNGETGSPMLSAPFERQLDIPAVAAPGTQIPVRAIARDAAGNSGAAAAALTITAQPDNQPPTISLNLPSQAAPGTTIRFTATAADNDGVASVVFAAAGTTLLTDADAPFEAAFAVPADAAPGSSVQFTARAADHTGNHATATGVVTIAEAPDTTAPVVQLTAPATVAPGGTINASATVTDAGGVAAVVFTVDNALVATLTSAPYQAIYQVPSSAVPGTSFRIEARAVDFAGLEGSAVQLTQMLVPPNTDGFLVGEVYDDRTGLPLAGGAITVRRSEGSGQPLTATGDDRGRFAIGVAPGAVHVHVERSGFTSADRFISVSGGTATELLDARLTPLSSPTQVAPVLGGTVGSGALRLDVPAGALAAQTMLVLTPLGQQGLQSPLPAGWSPVAVADLLPLEVSFTAAATLHAAVPASVAPGTQLTLVMWDAQARGWRAVAQAAVPTGGNALDAQLPSTGQFAWVLADQQPSVPPTAVLGEIIAGVPLVDVPQGVTTTISPEPKIIFYQPGVHSAVTGALATPSPLPSGTRLWARTTEFYRFRNGSETFPDPTVQDLALYQAPGDGLHLAAGYTATPSRTFEPLSLERGVIGLELYVPPGAGAAPAMITSAGGSATTETGERLEFPAGTVAAPIAAAISRLAAADIGAPVPASLTFIGAVDVSITGGAVTGSGVLSIAKPATLPADAQVLVARLVTIQDRTRFVLVALGRVDGDRLVADPMLPRNRVEMEGVRTTGRYVFVTPTQPIGFFTGRVLDGAGRNFGGAQVSADPFPVVALSRTSSGIYVSPAVVGEVSLTALDLATSDRGAIAVTVNAARDEQSVDLRLVAEPPRVTSITPANNARNVSLSSAVVVVFSEPIDPATVSGTNAANAVLLDGAGVPVAAALTLAGGNTLLTVRPAVALQPNANYTFTLAAAVADRSGQTLGAPVSVAFTSLDTSAPPPPVAGTVTATIPDESGNTTVRGAQGTAGLHDTVSVENVTRGTSTPVLLDPNGGFLVLVQTSLRDTLKLKILDEAGNETTVDVPGFTRQNPDGSISGVVNAAGGRVDGPNGTAVQVPPGSLPDGTIVTLKSILESEFPVPLEEAQKQYFPYSGGVRVDFSGVTPARYVNISLPATAQDKPGDQWVVAQAIDVGGQQVLNAVDTAKLINGRVQTSSPPCPGVLATGVYGIYKSVQPVGLAWGRMYQDGAYDGMRMSIQVPPTLAGIAMPFPVYSWENPLPICLPMITSRVTVGPNTIRLKLRPEALTAADREVIVRNTTTGRDSHFRRDLLEYAFEVPGTQNDEYQAIVVDQAGAQTSVASIAVKPGPTGKVIVALDANSIHVAVAEIVIRNLTPNPDAEYRFPRAEVAFEVQVGGGISDSYEITAVDADHVSRAVDMGLVDRSPSPYGPDNLLAKALPGTIDPTLDEILAYNALHPDAPLPTGKYRTSVELSIIHTTPDGPDPDTLPDTTTSTQVIPASLIAGGGFAYAFSGEDTPEYAFAIQVVYNTGETEYVRIPRIRFVVTNAQTGQVIKSYEVQAPPRDEPYSVGVVTNDTQPPLMTGSPMRLNSFDPSAPLTFQFSEAMSANSIKNGAVVEWVRTGGGRVRVAGTWRVYGQNRTATFVPDAPLRLGEEYSITFVGKDSLGALISPGTAPVTDYGGNSIATMRMPLKTFAPRLVSQLEFGKNGRPMEEIKDLQIRRRTVGGQQKTYLFATTNSWIGGGLTPIPPARFVAIDVTDVDHPVETGFAFGGQIQKGLTLVPDIGLSGNPPMPFREPISPPPPPCGASGDRFTGDMAVSAAYNINFSMVQTWDVRDPNNPCLMSSKLLTANPDTLNSYTTPGTVHATGFAESVATLRHSNGVAAFVAVRNVGLMVSDLGQNIPELLPGQRTKEAFAPGDPWDVVAFQDRLITVDNTERTLDIWDANLAKLASLALPKQPRAIVTAENFGVDENGDGIIRPSEVRDLAFVAARECASGGACTNAIYVVDLKGLQRPQEIGHIDMPGSVFKLDVDPEKKRLFAVGSYSSTDSRSALFMIDVSNPAAFAADADHDGLDDRIVWRHGFDAPTSWVNWPRIDKERGLAYIPTAGAVASRYGPLQIWAIYDNCCDLAVDFTAAVKEPPTGDRDSLLRKEKEALQAGIATGLQQAHAVCGLDTSSISILEQGSGACLWRGKCDDNYQPGLSDHDYEVFLRDADYATPVAGTTLANCTVTELNNVFRDPRTGDSKEIPIPSGGKMAFDDITFFPEVRERFETAVFDVERPLSGGSDAIGDMGLGRRSLMLKWLLEGAYVTGVPGYTVAGRALDLILQDLKNVTHIRQLEGYEWSVLQDFALAKSKAYVRIKGAADPASAFHKLFVKQLHDAGKAGIRTTMARIVADPVGNTTVLDVTRQQYETSACVDVDPLVTNPGSWRTKPCSSFEEYVASTAARMLREGRTLFTYDEVVNQAHRFFRVKSDRERIISETRANQFVALVSQFIANAKILTMPVYNAQLPTDPDVTLRTGNMTFAQGKLAEALASAKIPLSPHVFNQGFRNGTGLLVKMYTTDAEGTGAEVASTRIDLNGGEDRYLAFQRNADGTLVLDNGKARPIFNLAVDLLAAGTAPHGVSFLIDIPDRSMKEANRENNLGGFFYYVLDRATGATPAVPPQSYFPLANRTDLLKPSPECFDSPTLQVTQRLMIGSELIGDQAILGRGEAVTITLNVTNYSGETVTGALACSNITNQCYEITTPIAPGGTGSVTINYVTPNEDRYIDGTPSLFSPQTGVQTGAATRLIVNGSAYTIQSLMDEAVVKAIDPELLNIEAGGTLHRHYRVVGKRSGLPKPNLTVTGELEGFFGSTVAKRAFTFRTNSFGEICVPASGGACTGDERSIDIPYDPSMVTSTSYTMTLKQVDGVDIPIENRTAFTYDVKDRGWSQNYSVGGNIGAGVKIIAGPGMEVEDGFELSKSGKFFTGPESLDLSLSRQVTFKAKAEEDIGFTVKTPLIAAKAEAKAGVSASVPLSWTDAFTFPYVRNASPLPGAPPFILEFTSHCAIANLTMSFLGNRNPLINRMANLLRETPCGDPQEFTKSHGFKVAGSAAASAGLDVGLQAPILGRIGNARPTIGLTAGASASGGLSVEYETSYQKSPTVPDDIELTGSTTKIGLFGQVEYNAAFGLSLSDTFRVKKPGVTPTPEDNRQDKFSMEEIEKALKVSTSSVEGGAFSLELEQDKDGAPKSVGIGFAQPKSFGWNAEGAGGNLGLGFGTSISFTLTRQDDIVTAVDRLANIQELANALLRNRSHIGQLTMTPTKLNEEVGFFRTLLFDTVATYKTSETRGTGFELPLGFEGKLKGVGFDIGVAFKGDSKQTFTPAKGVNYKGRLLPLQTYRRNDGYQPPLDMGLTGLIGQVWESVDASFGSANMYVSATVPASGDTVLRSPHTAIMTINGAAEPEAFDANLYSYPFTPIAGPVAEKPYRPSETTGPAGDPYYGIGGFHHFLPNDRTLAAPASLVIDYHDADVVGLDESTFAIYAWNDDRFDWDYVGGAVDPVANTVTTTVNRFRLYTVAPTMPGGTIALTHTDDGETGALETATRRFTVTSGTLLMNNGQPVPDGTLFTVRSVAADSTDKVDYGTMLTADEDAARDRVQVRVAGGRLQFQVEYPSPNHVYQPGKVIVYSTTGTAYGTLVLTRAVPQ